MLKVFENKLEWPALPVELKKNVENLNSYFLPNVTPRVPWVPSKIFSQFGPVVWPAIANIMVNKSEDLYYIDRYNFTKIC